MAENWTKKLPADVVQKIRDEMYNPKPPRGGWKNTYPKTSTPLPGQTPKLTTRTRLSNQSPLGR